MAFIPVDRGGLGRCRVEEQHADLAAPRGGAREDGGHVMVGGVAVLGHTVEPQFTGGAVDDPVPLLSGDQAPVGVWPHGFGGCASARGTIAWSVSLGLMSRAAGVRGEAENLRGDLQRVGEPAQHRDVRERREAALVLG
jgi:hypothetical protein